MSEPRHVVHLIDSVATGGAETTVLQLVQASADDPVEYTVGYLGNEHGEVSLEGKYERAGARVENFGSGFIFEPTRMGRIQAYLGEHDVDVVHCHLPQSIILGRLVARLAGVSSVVSTHHSPPEDFGRIELLLESLTRRLDSQTVAVSNHVRELFPGASDAWRTVHNGIDVDDFESQRSPEEVERLETRFDVEDKLVLLNVGRYHPDKRQIDIVRAMDRVIEEISDVHLLLVGWGDLERQLRNEVQSLGLEEHVTITGYVPNGQIANFYGLSDVFVFPSVAEALGNVVLEAMASRLPTVATWSPNVDELIVDGQSGIVVETQSPDELADAIVDLRSPETRERIGDNAYRRVREEFSIAKTANAYLDVYASVEGASDETV